MSGYNYRGGLLKIEVGIENRIDRGNSQMIFSVVVKVIVIDLIIVRSDALSKVRGCRPLFILF